MRATWVDVLMNLIVFMEVWHRTEVFGRENVTRVLPGISYI